MHPALPGETRKAITGGKEEQKSTNKSKEVAGDGKVNAYDLFTTPHQYAGSVKKIMPSKY